MTNLLQIAAIVLLHTDAGDNYHTSLSNRIS